MIATMGHSKNERNEIKEAISRGTSRPEVYPKQIILNAFIPIGIKVRNKGLEIFNDIHQIVHRYTRREKRLHDAKPKQDYPPRYTDKNEIYGFGWEKRDPVSERVKRLRQIRRV